ncbi:hypothetical protein QFZ79_001528 [Arthrobacter sp. V4I6]|nr:hypothetical protein [Arthrobacter sp. V4I6]
MAYLRILLSVGVFTLPGLQPLTFGLLPQAR